MKMQSMLIQTALAAILSGCATMPEGSIDDTSRLVDQITQSLKNLDQDSLNVAFEAYKSKHKNHLYIETKEYPYWSAYELEKVREESNQAMTKLINCNSSMERSRLGKKDDEWKKCNFDQFRILDGYRYLPTQPNRNLITKRFQDYEAEQKAADKKASSERARLAVLKAEEDEKKQMAEQKLAEERKEKDPKTWSERACSSQKLIELSKETIRREQAGAKHSGVVNQQALYGAGQTIELMQEHQTKQKAEYKRLSGKEWTPRQCE